MIIFPLEMRKIIFCALFFAAIALMPHGANCFVLTQDLKDEISDEQFLVKVHPKDPQSHFELAMTYAYSNRIEDGLSELKTVDDLDPKFAKKAYIIYGKKARIFPNDWKVRFRYAFALYFNKKKSEAIDEFKKVIKQDPGNVFAYGYIATIYGEMDDLDSAIDYAKKAVEIDSNVAAIHLLLGTGYYKKGQAAQGLAETMEALRLRALGY